MPPAMEFVLLVLAVALLTRWGRNVGAAACIPALVVGGIIGLVTD